jgi:hypothetical protein
VGFAGSSPNAAEGERKPTTSAKIVVAGGRWPVAGGRWLRRWQDCGLLHHRIEDVRDALTIDQSVPMVTCDARNRQSTKQTLITLVEHAMRQWMSVRAG